MTVANSSIGAPPTRCVGESASQYSGYFASRFCSSRMSVSNSKSLISVRASV
jgi:hypothetical protein